MIQNKLTVSNLKVGVRGSKNEPTKVLIENLSTEFKSGELTIIMGPSGGCKSTFINCITGDIHSNMFTNGKILYNGNQRKSSTWNKICGVLLQDDTRHEMFTVFNWIYYNVIYNTNKSSTQLKEDIYAILDDMEMGHIADNKMNTISGGECRRVFILIEILKDSEILLLDEPTSGLDSNMSLKICAILKKWAKDNNKIVIMTVHNPGPGLFRIFDKIILLYSGTPLYDGPVQEAKDYFEAQGFVNKTKLSFLEYMFELISKKSPLEELFEDRENIKSYIFKTKTEISQISPNIPVDSGSRSKKYIDYSVSFRDIFLIIKEKINLVFSNLTISQVIWLIFGLSLYYGYIIDIISNVDFLLFDFCNSNNLNKDRLTSSNFFNLMNLINLSKRNYNEHLKSTLESIKTIFNNEKLFNDFFDMFIYSSSKIFYTMVPIFTVLSYLYDKGKTKHDLKKRHYSILSLYIANFIMNMSIMLFVWIIIIFILRTMIYNDIFTFSISNFILKMISVSLIVMCSIFLKSCLNIWVFGFVMYFFVLLGFNNLATLWNYLLMEISISVMKADRYAGLEKEIIPTLKKVEKIKNFIIKYENIVYIPFNFYFMKSKSLFPKILNGLLKLSKEEINKFISITSLNNYFDENNENITRKEYIEKINKEFMNLYKQWFVESFYFGKLFFNNAFYIAFTLSSIALLIYLTLQVIKRNESYLYRIKL